MFQVLTQSVLTLLLTRAHPPQTKPMPATFPPNPFAAVPRPNPFSVAPLTLVPVPGPPAFTVGHLVAPKPHVFSKPPLPIPDLPHSPPRPVIVEYRDRIVPDVDLRGT